MKKDIADFIKPCKSCQLGKRGFKGYGKLPLKDVESEPWEDMCLDLAGPWTAKLNGKEIDFHCLTIIDPFTGWIEIIPILNKTKEHVVTLIEQEWLRRYPRPRRAIFDRGGEFDNRAMWKLCAKWQGMKFQPITSKNPTSNSIVERVHKVLADMLRCQLATQYEGDDPIKDMMSAAAYAIRSTVHGTTRYTPGQLIFNRDMIWKIHMEADLAFVRNRREAEMIKNNERENN